MFPGLDPGRAYHVGVLELADTRLGLAGRQPAWTAKGADEVPGDMLSIFGLQLPVLDPQTAILLHVTSDQPATASAR